jgi:CRISPR-associated protein Csc1
MECIPIKMTVISPIQYFFTAAAGGMRTSNFIGDIALKYAFLRQMGLFKFPDLNKTKPTYTELRDFPFWLTTGIPTKMALGSGDETEFMKNMIRNTMQGADYNGSNVDPTFKTGSLMYKNFFFVQPIKPGNIFYSFLIFDSEYYKNFDLPEVIRVGNNRTGMLKISMTNADIRAVINLYTIQNILGKHIEKKTDYVSHLVLQYYLVGYYNKAEVSKIYGDSI